MNVEHGKGQVSGTSAKVALGAGKILQFATFKLNGELLGLNILQVQEIQQPQPITPVPLAPEHVLGLISLRGQIVPLINLRKRLGMDTSEPIANPYHIVVHTPYATASFEIDDIRDVVDVPEEDFAPPPESVKAIDARFLEGVYPLGNEILTVLKLDVVLGSE